MQDTTINAKGKNAGSLAIPKIYSSGLFKPVVDKCEGCERVIAVEENRYCRTYADPSAKWKLGICNFATHVKPEITAATVKVNPLKAAKRASRRK